MVVDVKNELVDFIVHQAFYPVLMADRAGPNRAMIEHVQGAARAEIDRFRSYKSAQEVIASFKRDYRTEPAKDIHFKLKLLCLPVIDDLYEDFERKARELGFEPDDTLLTSPLPRSNTGDISMDQERISQRAHAIWESAGQPDGAHDEHWQQACREIDAEDGTMTPDPTFAAEITAEDGAPSQSSKATLQSD